MYQRPLFHERNCHNKKTVLMVLKSYEIFHRFPQAKHIQQQLASVSPQPPRQPESDLDWAKQALLSQTSNLRTPRSYIPVWTIQGKCLVNNIDTNSWLDRP